MGGNPISYVDPDGLNPVAGAIEGGEIGFVLGGPPGAVAGVIIGGIGGYLIADQLDSLFFSKGGRQDIRDTGVIGVSDEEIGRRLKDPTTVLSRRREEIETRRRTDARNTRNFEKIMLYCAHAIFYFKLLGQDQDSFLVHENVYLIEADDDAQAAKTAANIGKENEDVSEDGHLEVNEQKAAYVFAGIRKVVGVEPSPVSANASGLIGLELSYSEFEVDTLDQVLALARGEMIEVLYRE